MRNIQGAGGKLDVNIMFTSVEEIARENPRCSSELVLQVVEAACRGTWNFTVKQECGLEEADLDLLRSQLLPDKELSSVQLQVPRNVSTSAP